MPLQSAPTPLSTLIGRLVMNLNTAAEQPIKINASRYQLTGMLLEGCTGDPQLAEGNLYRDTGSANLLTDFYFPAEFPNVNSSLFYPNSSFSTLGQRNILTAQTLYVVMTVLEGTADTCNLWLYGIRL